MKKSVFHLGNTFQLLPQHNNGVRGGIYGHTPKLKKTFTVEGRQLFVEVAKKLDLKIGSSSRQ